ncbi:sulfurtransferase complex subunit TusD [Buchnera aphidicola]|nr:sulfurtransferase complex subunit TusD [Buchnera aphidicola]
MKYALIVMSSPYNEETSITAYLFAKHVIKMNHKLYSVFFFANGALHTNMKDISTNMSCNLTSKWNKLSIKFGTKLYICINSALKMGLISHKNDQNDFFSKIGLHFKLVGLGVLVKNMQKCDRVLQL